ncbi:hypothetical protein [Bradyrhizobium sp. 17]|uniref:hypothetical protein n=1 Tax=Bradyrhizobium sp. 17 TaxID=2782649 RepID=UPI001FF79C48|nr:hypothetical protein [Bradyrhizobium sp. 17]MCK1519395.1 hypothetical protein [Bradyrhizobium sp. 17]
MTGSFTTADATPATIFLDGDHRFVAIDCADNTNCKGLLIPNVRIEVDETSVYDTVGNYAPPGMVVRQNDGLFVAASADACGCGAIFLLCSADWLKAASIFPLASASGR